MDEQLIYFLENTLVSKPAIESRLTHPFSKLEYPTRLTYDHLKKHATDFLSSGVEPRFLSLAGLRGVGKTTLLWQTANHIYNTHHQNIYFFNVNILKTIGVDLFSALEAFQRHILKKRFNEFTEPITLLFDEVHEDENWSKTLKILYDEARTAFILCTGSFALLLNSTADLSRRMHIMKVFPFSFSELLRAKEALSPEKGILTPSENVSLRLKEALFYSENALASFRALQSISSEIDAVLTQRQIDLELLQIHYLDFLNFPNLLYFDDERIITNAILDLFTRIIHEDVPKLKPGFTDFAKLERLILRLAGSDEINPEKLAGIVGVKQNDINALIELLAKAEVLHVLVPYGGLDTKIAKNKKAFFMSPSLRRALLCSLYGHNLPDQFKSKLVEDMVVMYLRRVLTSGTLSFFSGKNDVNPDFVIETRDQPILLEIGTSKTSLKQLKQSHVKYRYGLLITNGVTEPTLKVDCIQLPLNWFLLL
jgi:predicted AAA+ superfamily ATPase